MKKKYFFLFACLLFSLVNTKAQLRSDRDLLGTWQGDGMKVEFYNNAKLRLTVSGGQLPLAAYKTDFMSTPARIVITLEQNGQKIIYKGSIEFIDKDAIRLRYSDSENAGDGIDSGQSALLHKIH